MHAVLLLHSIPFPASSFYLPHFCYIFLSRFFFLIHSLYFSVPVSVSLSLSHSICQQAPCGCGLCLAVAAAGGLPDVSLCRTGPRGLLLKRGSVLHLRIALHDHFLLPTHSSQAALCAKAEKSPNRGVQSTTGPSTGPYSSSLQCSSLLLPYQPQDGFILNFTNIPLLEALRSTGCSFLLSSGA